MSLTDLKVKNDVHNQIVHDVIRTRSRIFSVTVIICLKIHIVQFLLFRLAWLYILILCLGDLNVFCTALTCIVYQVSLQGYMSSPSVLLLFCSLLWSVFINSVCSCPFPLYYGLVIDLWPLITSWYILILLKLFGICDNKNQKLEHRVKNVTNAGRNSRKCNQHEEIVKNVTRTGRNSRKCN